jgi:hypothetical protein
LLLLIGAATVLIVYGALWWSVRGQHPYSGPAGWALAVLYGTLLVWVGVVVTFRRRATSGVGGRSSRQRRAAGPAFATIWISVYVFQGALHHADASHAIVYGIYPAVAPFLIVGGAAAAYATALEEWRAVGFSLAAVALAAGAAFAGPIDVWGVMGIGVCALVVAYAVMQVVVRRAPV